ncbi:MAG: DUF115 domain-containing protein [Treponema sp.]|jgi:hypothetical protein|nr:DUF115 domain-containing protein [Treponema sp.]
MNYWERNSRIIQEKFPGLAEHLSTPAPWDEGDMRVETAASGDPTLIIQDRSIHSRRDPRREAQRLAETLSGSGPRIILGFGLGYAAEASLETLEKSEKSEKSEKLEKKDKTARQPIIIVERHGAVLRKALETRDLRLLLSASSIIFVLGGAEEGITGALHFCETQVPGGKAAPELIRNRGLMQLDPDWYAGVERHIRVWTSKDAVNQATLRRFGKRWVRNSARNREAIRDLPGIGRLAGVAAPHIPIFLAAAGPSLDRVIPILQAIRTRCVVVAVDTALRLFQEAGVAPDFAVVVDPQYWNARHLDRISLHKTCLIAESSVYPQVLRIPAAQAFLCASLYPIGSFIEARLDPKGRLGAGGSVATTAWDFARTLGSSAIWIAGLDLAFPGFKTHYRGARFEELAHGESTRLIPAETRSFRALRDGNPFWAAAADGSRVLTDQRLALYAAWFENRFHHTPELRNYRLSGEGLALSGLITASEEELLALPEQREEIDRRLAAAFSQVQDDFMQPDQARERAARYEAALGELREGLTTVRTLADEAVAIAGKGAQPCKPGAEQPLRQSVLRELEGIKRKIVASPVKDVAGFLVPSAADLEAAIPVSVPFTRYLECSSTVYRLLSEAAAEQLTELNRECFCT